MEMSRGSLLANLFTVGNGICGFAALVKLSQVELLADGTGFKNPENFTIAAFLVLLGMVFDVFDGKIARLARGSTELGAQLDSFCDLVTFGLVPAFLIVRLNLPLDEGWRQRIVWFFALAYFLGAMLRLARFNVENSPDESAHLCFKGLPSPGAAGCVASLVIFQRYILKAFAPGAEAPVELRLLAKVVDGETIQSVAQSITYVLVFLGPVLGLSMVASKLKFEHVGSKLFARGHSVDFVAYLIFGIVLLWIVPEVMLPLAFCGYLVWTPVVAIWRRARGRRPAEAREVAQEAADHELGELR
jgi:CDP-diacylglycerol--serine O-phosphatidyltransferase